MIRRATLFFEPLDVLQFRDHRPFDAGYQVAARSVFPMPSVFLGCLRTVLLRDRGVRFGAADFGLTEPWARDLLGTTTAPGSLTLRGPLLAWRRDDGVEPLFPWPRDLVETEIEADRDTGLGGEPPSPEVRRQALELHRLSARRFHGVAAVRCDMPIAWSSRRLAKSPGSALLTRAAAKHYLDLRAAEIPNNELCPADAVYVHERRVGIVRSNLHLTADDRMLYVTRPFRLVTGAGLAVDVELPGGPADAALRALDGRVVPLGGKARRAVIRYHDGPLIPDALAPDATHTAPRKLWLITPLVLAAASSAQAWPATVTCMATDRSVAVGGFDLARHAPKPLRHALPAGTILTLRGISPDDALASLAGPSWAADRRAGYGVALACKPMEHT